MELVELAAAAGLGLALGVVTGMPLGVVNVAIVDAAAASRPRLAIGIGLGGAVADTAHALVAFVGVGQLVTARPALVRALAIAAALLIVGYAIVAWRRRRAPTAPHVDAGSTARGFAVGLALTLPNPGALAAWVAVAAALWPAATTVEAALLAAGVGIGSAIWFTALAGLVRRIPADHAALRLIPRVALVVLVAIAGYGVVRALAA